LSDADVLLEDGGMGGEEVVGDNKKDGFKEKSEGKAVGGRKGKNLGVKIVETIFNFVVAYCIVHSRKVAGVNDDVECM
jgi:hypothetical protein